MTALLRCAIEELEAAQDNLCAAREDWMDYCDSQRETLISEARTAGNRFNAAAFAHRPDICRAWED